MPRKAQTFARFVVGPENRGAMVAVRQLASWLTGKGEDANRPSSVPATLLHGPSGVGKTHLVQALIAEVTQRCPRTVVCLLAAADLALERQTGLFDAGEESDEPPESTALEHARHCDLLVVEDLQHLDRRLADPLVGVFDYLQSRGQPMLFTADAGPQRLARRGMPLPARLTSRLAEGLVVGMGTLGAAGRLELLQMLAQRRQLAVATAVLRWLADHLGGGGRQLEGAVQRLETLARAQKQPLDIAAVEPHFREQAEAVRPTVERIARHVGGYYRVDPRELQSARRHRDVLVPRQVGMYLARRLTDLSLEQIGDYFGGRDHATVLHACRKVEEALTNDPVLCGAVRELHAAFT
jgi:chromosomal replication initiator protein